MKHFTQALLIFVVITITGATTECDCSLSDNYELKDEIRSLHEGISLLNKSLTEAQAEIKTLKRTKERIRDSCWDGVIVEDQCIKLLYTQGYATFYAKAQRLCRNYNSTLAEITSDAMYNSVHDYVRSKWIIYTNADREFVDVWLGSTFKVDGNVNHVITLVNGTTMRWDKWFPKYPLTKEIYASHTNMAMEVRTRDSSENEGLFNASPSFQYAVPLCAYTINV